MAGFRAGHLGGNFLRKEYQAVAVVIHCSSFCFGAAPTWREASSPFLNSISVGIDMMPYLAAVAGFSSTLSFTILTLPFIVPAISSRAGAIILQGPHHSAQKSTTTGSALFSTSVSKSLSDTFETPIGHLGCCAFWVLGEPPLKMSRNVWSAAVSVKARSRLGVFTRPKALTTRH